MNSTQIIFALIALFTLSGEAQSNITQYKYVGKSTDGQSCEVFVVDKDYGPDHKWITYTIKAGTNFFDTSIVRPVQSTKTIGGECSLIPGRGEDTLIVDETSFVQHRRFAEFGKNWIQEALITFDGDFLAQLKGVEFKVGASAASGRKACDNLQANRLESHITCTGLLPQE